MRKVKRRREDFLLCDYAGVERHLEKQAAKGWYLTKIEGGMWIYHKKEPVKLRYSVTYIPTASEYDPVQTEDETKLDEYCKMAGWTKVTNWLQMQIYCTDDPDAVEVETDESVRLDVIRRAMRKTFLISHLLMLLVFALNGYSRYISYRINPIHYLSQNSEMIMLVILFSGVLFVFVGLSSYLIWLKKSEKSVASGGKCAGVRFYRPFNYGGLIWILFLFLCWLFSMNRKYALLGIVGMLGFLLCIYLVHQTREVLRRKGVEKTTNIFATLVVDFVSVIIMVGIITWIGFRGIGDEDVPVDTYLANGIWWDIYQDDIPVKIEDLMPVDYDHYSYEIGWEQESFLMANKKYAQQSFADGQKAPSMTYEVTNVKWDCLYDWCLESYLAKYEDYIWDDGYSLIDTSDWSNENIDQVWRVQYEDEPGNEWIICNGNTILCVTADWELTEEQMEIMMDRVSEKEA